MTLSVEELALLIELKSVRTRVISGLSVAKVTSHGRSVEYSQANLGKLDEEIAALERRAGRRRGGAIAFRF